MKTRNSIIEDTTSLYIEENIQRGSPFDPKLIEKELLELISREIALENAVREKNNKIPSLHELQPNQIANIILAAYDIVNVSLSDNKHDELQYLAVYQREGKNEGLYVHSNKELKNIILEFNYTISKKRLDEVISLLEILAPTKTRTKKKDLVAVGNGIFDYKHKKLLPFSPEYVYVSKCRVNYVENPENPKIEDPNDGTIWDIESWMHTLHDDPSVVELLWEILGAIVRPYVKWNKSAWLYSEKGNNGKGTLCELMRNIVGIESTASIPLSKFSEKFALEPLLSAQAIIVDENDVGTFIEKSARLKAVITNDVIDVDRKHKPIISYRFYGFMVQCLNEYPRIRDRSESFARRQLYIPMNKNFRGIEKTYIKDEYLKRTDVLEYALWKILNTDYYKLSEPEICKLTLHDYNSFNDPIVEFWDEFESELMWDFVPFSFLYDLYKAWLEYSRPGGKPQGKKVFKKEIIKHVENSDIWKCDDPEAKIRPKNAMDKTELLINEYNLIKWKNTTYSGKDINKICIPTVRSHYRGIERK